MIKRYKLPIFVLILLIAAAGRILNIDMESLWVDEGFSYWAIRHHDMFGLLLRDVHPPLYFVGLRGWAGVAGITELALRYFSVIPSLLSVAVIYHVARELERLRFKTETVIPMLAALLLALADMENYIAQQTRMYTWHVLWVVCSMWFFLRWVRLRATWQVAPTKVASTQNITLILWMITSLLLVYTHYIGVCLLAVQGLYVMVFLRGRQRIEAIAALTMVGVLFIPWLLVVVSGQTDNVGTGFNVPSTLESLWNWRVDWFTQQWALMIGLAVLGLVTIRYGRGDLSGRPYDGRPYTIMMRPVAPAFLMLAWLVIPVALTYILNLYTPILMDYRITQITPAIALLIAFGLGNIRQPILGFLVAVIVVYGVTINDTPRPRPPWREVGRDAAQYAAPGDLALAHVTPSGDWQVMYYYERFMPDGVERRSLRQWQLEEGDTYATGLPALLEEYPHVWFMHWSKDNSGFEALAQTGHVQTALMTEDWLGNDLNVYRFDVLPAEAVTEYTSGMVLRDALLHADQLQIDLFWSAAESLPADYTVSAILLDSDGQLMAQDDAQPFINQRPTTTWQPGEVVYDPHILHPLNGELPPGTYTVAVKVYLWSPEGITVMPTLEGDEFAVIATLER